MTQFVFLYEISNPIKRKEYVQTLLRIVETEIEQGTGWQTTQTAPPKSRHPWTYAKAGYITKLENEEVIERVYDSNQYTQYRLTVSHEAALEEIGKFEDVLDDSHRERFEELH